MSQCINPPHGIAEIRKVYGDIKLGKINGKIDIIAPAGWERQNCIVVRDLPGFGPRPLYIHKLIEEPLRVALQAAKQACPDYLIKTMGCFCPRMKRTNGAEPSLHSWAVAVDINAATNPLSDTLVTDMPPAFVEAFEHVGWTWGGRFKGRKDAMHMQFAGSY